MNEKKDVYIMDYQQAIDAALTQNGVFWSAEEIDVEKDTQDFKVNCTEAEKQGIVEVLRLFTEYELVAGDEYWGGKFKRLYPRPCLGRMANSFSYFEINVHAPFYNKLNETLNLNTEDFFSSYKKDEDLKQRKDFLEELICDEDDLTSISVFSMVEGAILYSSFAFLKHFQANGKNKFMNVVTGINSSVVDENLHSEAGAWVYKQRVEEIKAKYGETEEVLQYLREVEDKIIASAKKLYEHETLIINKIFKGGNIKGITEKQLDSFVQSRIDLCLNNLGIKPIYKPAYNPISSWFYKNINSGVAHDFFTKVGNDYNRSWNKKRLIFTEDK